MGYRVTGTTVVFVRALSSRRCLAAAAGIVSVRTLPGGVLGRVGKTLSIICI